MKTFFSLKKIFITTCLLSPIILAAQVNDSISKPTAKKDTISTSAKIDSIYTIQKTIYNEQKNNPLYNKRFGIEFNFFRLLYVKELTLSGGFSIFDLKHKAEISFPMYFQKPSSSRDLTEFTIDCHYRYFLRNTLNGFYLSAFSRYAFLSGTLGNNDFWGEQSSTTKSTENKLGLGFGLGYRIFSYKGLYWGASLSVGRYLIGKSDKFQGDFLALDDDNEFIFDIEFFKFGWAF